MVDLWERITACDGPQRTPPYRGIVTEKDRIYWDEQYARAGMASAGAADPPPMFGPFQHLFPTSGQALELACGRGRCAVWLAARGMDVWGVDVSPVAVGLARELAERSGVGDRCRFDVVDLDEGLPDGPSVDLIMSYLFRDPRLDPAVIERLAPGGLLAIAALSTVDVGPGAFRAGPGELRLAYAELDLIAESEGHGEAWLLARA
jgi:SAM-dependent methyltransferase